MSKKVRSEEVKLSDDGYIHLDGTVVGYLGWESNTLVDIGVDKEYRGRGIATEAVRQLVERLNKEGYDVIETTTVVSGAMQIVLERNGFDRRVVEKDIAVNEDLALKLDDPPREKEIEWVREL